LKYGATRIVLTAAIAPLEALLAKALTPDEGRRLEAVE
jgi:hypothetical protein